MMRRDNCSYSRSEYCCHSGKLLDLQTVMSPGAGNSKQDTALHECCSLHFADCCHLRMLLDSQNAELPDSDGSGCTITRRRALGAPCRWMSSSGAGACSVVRRATASQRQFELDDREMPRVDGAREPMLACLCRASCADQPNSS